MSDEQLADAVNGPFLDEASMMAAMDLLEKQTELRNEDLRLEAMWALEMQSNNTPESLAALHAFRTGTPYVAPSSNVEPTFEPPIQVPSTAFSIWVELEASTQSSENSAPTSLSTFEFQPSVSAGPSLFEQIASQVQSASSGVEVSQPHDSQAQQSVSQEAVTREPVLLEPDQEAPFVELATVEPETETLPETLPENESPSEAEPEPEVPAVFPLVPVAPAPDISVIAELETVPGVDFDFSIIAPLEQPRESFEGNPPKALPKPVAALSAEQQVTEFEETLEQPVENLSDASSESLDVEEAFNELVGIEPKSASEFLEDARVAVSTAHGPKTNQGASALFFNWLPIGGSVLPVVLAVYVHSLGLALTEAVVAVLIAIFAAFATTTAGAIAGKRAGLPTFVVSRATFGVFGARIPAAFFAVLKLATASVMVLLLVVASQSALPGWSVEGPTATRWQVGSTSVALWQLIIGVAVLLVAVTSFVKLRYIKFLNLFVGILASVGVIGALTLQLSRTKIDAEFFYLHSWPQTLGAAAIVFAALGSVWSSSGADFASLLKQSIKGTRVIGWSALSLLLVPSVVSVATLVLLNSTEPKTSLLGFASIVPKIAAPYAYAIFAAVVLLLAAIELRSTKLAVRGLNPRLSGPITQLLLTLAFVAISLAGWHFYSTEGLLYNLHDYALVLSAPVAAWLGIFASDSLMRRIAYHEISLTRSYGFYGNFNFANLFGWVLASAAGLGMLASKLPEFEWVGFLARYSVNPAFWAESNLGIAAAFAIGALFPLCFGVPRIKRQEAEVLAIESRRYELRDVLVTSEIEIINPETASKEYSI